MPLSAADLAVLESRLANYLAAEAAVLRNQSYEFGDRKLTRANLSEIRKGIADLRGEIEQASGTPVVRGRARRGVIMS